MDALMLPLEDRPAFDKYLVELVNAFQLHLNALDGSINKTYSYAKKFSAYKDFTISDWAKKVLDEMVNVVTLGNDFLDYFQTRKDLEEISGIDYCYNHILKGEFKTTEYASALSMCIRTILPDKRRQYIFRKQESSWLIIFDGRKLPHLGSGFKGLDDIAYLLRHPGQQFAGKQLEAARADKSAKLNSAPTMDVLRKLGSDETTELLQDPKATAKLKEAIDELQQEYASTSDPERRVETQETIKNLKSQLKSSLGLGGRSRTFTSSTEKANRRIRKNLDTVITAIRRHDPALADHLERSIVCRNSSFSYQADASKPIPWQL